MSTPAQEQQRAQERAAWLAETAANALSAARSSLGRAADVTRDVDNFLRRSEQEVFELPGQANRIAVESEPRPWVRNVQQLADQADQRVRYGQQGINEVRDRLSDGARALKAGRDALTELSELPVEHDQAAMSRLSSRIDALDRAVVDFGEGIDNADRRLVATRETLDPLINSSANVQDRDATAAGITNAAQTADSQLMHTRAGLNTLNQAFDNTQADSHHAAAESADLARAFHAAANPTPRTDQQTQPAAADEAHHPKSDIASRLRDL
ncbi:hypothetical protein ACIA49_08865 [Kribbella sp. NPDC051587]|uniref:hypothetical protein n=1 Tax=Kribbella sp. NPDC051587 TaxID=3364119 RepID=UPI003789020D